MKLHFLLAIVLLSVESITAQQGINYKALIKDGSGNVVASDLIVIQFTILKGVGMTNVYQETHTPTTDANGLVIVNIGEGIPNSGDYSAIDWGSDEHHLNVQINTGGGLTDLSTTKFMAVPYALSAANAATKIDDLSDGKSDSDGTDDGSSLFLGIGAGANDDSTDNRNVGVGSETLKNNTTGRNNTANGYRALYSNTTGSENTANGYNALYSNTAENGSTATGYEALYLNSTGFHNTAAGYQALRNNTDGNNNTANGWRALHINTTGFSNTANGVAALYQSNGNNNTANGNNALTFNTTGSNNTAVGYGVLSLNSTGSNNTAIGYSAQVPDGTLDNQVRIGNEDVEYAGVQVAWTVTSDKRWKDNIRDLPYGLEFIKQLKPVDYIRKNNDAKTREMGFIAQDVEALLTKIGYTDQGFLHKDDKGFMSLRYNDFIALLTKAIQEQQEIIEEQKAELTVQKNENNQQNNAIEKLLDRVEKLEQISQ